MAIINISTSVGKDAEKREPLCIVGRNADWGIHCGKQYVVTQNILKMEVPYDPEISILGIYLKKPETLI